MGFFLGYSLFQIPKFFRSFFRLVRKSLIKIANRKSNKVDPEMVTQRNVNGAKIERDIEEEFKQFNNC